MFIKTVDTLKYKTKIFQYFTSKTDQITELRILYILYKFSSIVLKMPFRVYKKVKNMHICIIDFAFNSVNLESVNSLH